MNVSQEIQKIRMGRPHVVILGAGCSKAAVPQGDANGMRLPLMDDFLDVVRPVRVVLEGAGVPIEGKNFEEIYSSLVAAGHSGVQNKVESLIFDYFAALSLPDHPTLYDHLLLSLREKDVIATFNWDPFLIQALRRNPLLSGRAPQFRFLHGNVMVGFCERDAIQGYAGTLCQRCGKRLARSRLLYPVAEKNYENDPMIAASWKQLRLDLNHAFMVTVFGYGAPVSDKAATSLMQEALGNPIQNQLKLFEIIDIKTREELLETWEPFIKNYEYHYKIHQDFYCSYIARHPRRTGEAYIDQYLNGTWICNNPVPRELSFTDLWEWTNPLLEAENLAEPSARRE